MQVGASDRDSAADAANKQVAIDHQALHAQKDIDPRELELRIRMPHAQPDLRVYDQMEGTN